MTRPEIAGRVERLEAATARIAVLERALCDIACFSQTEQLLWWQEAARVALISSTKDEADAVIEAATTFARRTGKRFVPDPEKLTAFRALKALEQKATAP